MMSPCQYKLLNFTTNTAPARFIVMRMKIYDNNYSSFPWESQSDSRSRNFKIEIVLIQLYIESVTVQKFAVLLKRR